MPAFKFYIARRTVASVEFEWEPGDYGVVGGWIATCQYILPTGRFQILCDAVYDTPPEEWPVAGYDRVTDGPRFHRIDISKDAQLGAWPIACGYIQAAWERIEAAEIMEFFAEDVQGAMMWIDECEWQMCNGGRLSEQLEQAEAALVDAKWWMEFAQEVYDHHYGSSVISHNSQVPIELEAE